MVRTALVLLVLTACGRIGFDRIDDAGPGGSDAAIDGPAAFSTCVTPELPQMCSTTSSDVTEMAAGTFHTCVQRGIGVWCWGRNSEDQLGYCGDGSASTTVPLATFAFASSKLVTGELHSCALLPDGTLWCWGANFEGTSGGGISTLPSAIPHRVGGAWRDVAARRYHMCGIAADRSLWCWGHNDEGQLGLGDMTDRGFPTQVDTATDWDHVWVGGTHSCALKMDGTAWCWGDNTYGEVGDGSNMRRTAPVTVMTATRFKTISLGKHHVCGIAMDDSLWCWGRGNEGRLDNGMVGPGANRNLPVMNAPPSWKAVAAGAFHTCALEPGGAMWCWGDNSSQTLTPDTGMSTYSNRILIHVGPWSQVSAGGYTTCVTGTNFNELQCLGENLEGQLGVGDKLNRGSLTPLCL